MKKAILYVVLFVGLFGVAMIPDKVSILFFIDYMIRLAIVGVAGNKLVKLDKKPAKA